MAEKKNSRAKPKKETRGQKPLTREEKRQRAMKRIAVERTVKDILQADPEPCERNIVEGTKTKPPDGEILLNAIHWFKQSMQAPPQTDSEWAHRIASFFERCYETGEALLWEKFCLAMGYTTDGIRDMLIGRVKVTPVVGALLKKAKEIFAQLDAEMALKYKYNSAVYIFRSKQYYGAKTDKQLESESTEDTRDPLSVLHNLEELQEKYLKDVTDTMDE